MPERPSVTPEASRPRFDLSTILGIPVDDVEVHPDAQAMAREYLNGLTHDKTSQAEMAELAWALRRQLQTDLAPLKADESANDLPIDQQQSLHTLA